MTQAITAPDSKRRARNARPQAAEPSTVGPVASLLLDWYDRSGRDLPWRSKGGQPADPYRVWLSEVMLQQTTVRTVAPYYERFLALWPNVHALAAADSEDVMRAWAGLGYYARARNLHACAKAIVARHEGVFPRTSAVLATLPGVGAYTSAAIAAIAFGEPATPVDGNIERVVARLFAVTTPLPAAKPELRLQAATLTPVDRPGDYAQAMMDLGATICTPRKPSCMLCPIESQCRARALGIEAGLPARARKPEKPKRFGTAFVVLSETGNVLLRQRGGSGLLAGMIEVPSTPWQATAIPAEEALAEAPVRAEWWHVPGTVSHIFTHFRLDLTVLSTVVPAGVPLTLWARQEQCRWVKRDQVAGEALPSVMRKILAHAFRDGR